MWGACLWIFASRREDCGERGAKFTDLLEGLVGERMGEGEAVERGETGEIVMRGAVCSVSLVRKEIIWPEKEKQARQTHPPRLSHHDGHLESDQGQEVARARPRGEQ